MQTVKVKILGQVITPQYGTLSTGYVLTTDPAFARHLVEDCFAAEWVDPADANLETNTAESGATAKTATVVKATKKK